MSFVKNEVVISGISGKFPECLSIGELKEKLLSKSTMVKPDKEKKVPIDDKNYILTTGKVPSWEKFDFSFFGMPPYLVKNTDPILGMMLEKTFEAIIDAGVNPNSLKGRNIAVFAAPVAGDTEALCYSEASSDPVTIVGRSRAMMSNRISFSFNFTGPSITVDGSWVSSMQCLERAVAMVSAGQVEAAVVATAGFSVVANYDVMCRGLGFIADDGVCMPFDDKGHGHVRSEAVVAFFIQKRSDAKRIYSTILKVGASFMGEKDCGLLQLDPLLDSFLKQFYNGIKENPEDVSYVEAHGTSQKIVDEQELNALAGIFCANKKSPQLIGSITGNIGNTENCSGLVSTVKAILAMETGVIPPTIGYNTPNTKVPALVSGELKPVTEETELPGDLVAVNNLSCYGGFGHALLKRHDKVKKVLGPKELPEDGLPRLVLVQGRHQEGAAAACEKVSSMAVDVEYLSLVNDIFKTQIPNYLMRGFTIVPALQDKPVSKFKEFDPTKRPLWFVFSGMGSQWKGMGKELLQIPVFKASIEKCDKVLQPKGIDIINILSSEDATIFGNILNCFVGITAVQIGLVDILTHLKIAPDGIIGHSVGELGCAYADGCFTAEEAILAAYCRGKASVDSLDNDYIKGMMAAVGLGYNDIKDKLPPSIDVACHNSKESCTLSGPTDDVNNYVKQLQSEGVFARAVSAGGIAYHSRYIKSIAPKLLQLLQEVVPNPKPRSSKWISTSVPEAQWDSESAKLCSPEYLTNNLLNPVYFEEGCKHLPEDAILLEIAPHGLLQAILRRSVGLKTSSFALTNRTVPSNLNYLLECLGTLYLNNVDIDINALYPKVDYPVSRGTPSLAPLVSFNHSMDVYLESIQRMLMMAGQKDCEKMESIHTRSPQYKGWKDHRVRGQVVLSPAHLLMRPWEMIMTYRSQKIEEHFTILKDVRIAGNVPVNEIESVLYTTFFRGTLEFKVFYTNSDNPSNALNLLSGKFVEYYEKPQPLEMPTVSEDMSTMQETSETEIYFMLSDLGFELGPHLKIIKKLYIGKKECIAKLIWNGNVSTFLDSLMKVAILLKSREQGVLQRPTSFNKLSIDGPYLTALPLDTELEVIYDSRCNRVICQGAELLGLTFSPEVLTDASSLDWSELKFHPYCGSNIKAEEFLSYSVQTAAEEGFRSWSDDSCKINILVLETEDNMYFQKYLNVLKSTNRSKIEVKVCQMEIDEAKKQVGQMGREAVIVVGEYSSLAELASHCGASVHLYCISHYNNNGSQTLRPVSVCQTDSGTLTLLKRAPLPGEIHVCKIESENWIHGLRNAVNKTRRDNYKIIVVSEKLTPREVLPTLSKEPFCHNIVTVFIQDCDAPKFSLTNSLYTKQLSLGLSVNILSGGTWGSLRFTPLNIKPCNFNPHKLLNSCTADLSIDCVGLNTKDFSLQHKLRAEEPDLQYLDYCGLQKGQRVMGVAYYQSETNSLSPDSILQWPVPADWTLQDAATVPVLYTLAYYCINVKAMLERGERVLVHAGMSPLGQALISVALQAGADVIASVMDQEEVVLLTELFPAIKETNVFILGGEDINTAVRKITGGKGVNVTMNCLRGRDLQSTLNAADKYCRIVNLAGTRVEDKETIGMWTFVFDSYMYGVTLKGIEMCSDECKKGLRKSLNNGIVQGTVKPLKKKMFSLQYFTDALQNFQTNHAKEKTVMILKHQNGVLPQNGLVKYSLDDVHVIAGENMEIKLQLAERLIRHGTRNIVLLDDEHSKGGSFLKRINRFLHRSKSSTVIASSTCLDTVEASVQFLKETLRIGPISSIFCVCMDENSNKMQNLDAASRQVLPRLEQFVSLLGSGSAVCDSRASSGLPACSIRGERSLESAAKVLPYLFTLMLDSQKKAKCFFVSDQVDTPKSQENLDYLGYLPSSVEDLFTFGESVEEKPRFVEEVTRSQRYSEVRYCLLPVFMIPGLGQSSVNPLLRQLMYPTFCCRLSDDLSSVEKLAELLVQDITKIQPRGPYNIVGESWGGALALTVACLLEARGCEVNLVLIQGIPKTAKYRLRALCRKFGADLGTCIVNAATNTQAENAPHGSWSDRLQQLLETLEPDVRQPVSKAVTALNNQLKSFLQFQPPKQTFKGDITLIQNKNEPVLDLDTVFEKSPKFLTIDEDDHRQLLASFATASAVNENMAHTWNP